MIKFDGRLLTAVSYAVSTDPDRRNLRGVFFFDQVAVATNGAILTMAIDETAKIENPGTFAIPHEIQEVARHVDSTVVISNGEIEAQIGCGGVLVSGRSLQAPGPFPDYRRVLPAGPMAPSTTAFSSLIWEKVVKTAAALRGPYSATPITTWANSEADTAKAPHVVRYFGDPRILSVIMPIEWTMDESAIPEWAVKAATSRPAA